MWYSETDNVEIPTDEDLPNYKDDEIEKDYVPGQEDVSLVFDR